LGKFFKIYALRVGELPGAVLVPYSDLARHIFDEVEKIGS
jgi:hypothetical protein